MLNVITIIAFTLLGIGLLLLLLLAVPMEFAFDIQHDQSRRNDLSLVWMFGMIRIPLRANTDKQRQKKTKKKTKRRGQRTKMKLLGNAQFRKRLVSYVWNLIKAIRIKTLDLQIRLGLDDPADTGRLWSFVGPFSALLAEIRQAKIRIEPEFTAEVFSLNSHGRIVVIPLRILSSSLRFFLSPTVIRALVLNHDIN